MDSSVEQMRRLEALCASKATQLDLLSVTNRQLQSELEVLRPEEETSSDSSNSESDGAQVTDESVNSTLQPAAKKRSASESPLSDGGSAASGASQSPRIPHISVSLDQIATALQPPSPVATVAELKEQLRLVDESLRYVSLLSDPGYAALQLVDPRYVLPDLAALIPLLLQALQSLQSSTPALPAASLLASLQQKQNTLVSQPLTQGQQNWLSYASQMQQQAVAQRSRQVADTAPGAAVPEHLRLAAMNMFQQQLQQRPQEAVPAVAAAVQPMVPALPLKRPTSCYEGNVLIPMVTSSEAWVLSQYQCLLRQQICFVVSPKQCPNNGKTRGRNKAIVSGQVGLLCVHCASLPPQNRPKGSVYYPAQLRCIYHAAQNMALNHFREVCEGIPPDTRALLFELKEKKAFTAGAGEYWQSSARQLGICERETGLFTENQEMG